MSRTWFLCLAVGNLLVGSLSGFYAASAAELPRFVAEMKNLRVPTRYVEEALPTLRSIRFTRLGNTSGGTIEAVYNRLTNEVQFDLAIQDPSTGTLKPSDQLTPDQVGTRA